MKVNKFLIAIVLGVLGVITVNAQTLNPTFTITAPGAADSFRGGYTFSYIAAGTPWNGALISFGGAGNNYDCQISSDYQKTEFPLEPEMEIIVILGIHGMN
ncbi:hypothetical protein [Flavobacterium pectinovorum]|uniref:Uncharacterized protein n=1 Tax=Flavobacterium pectinovorum TaxID=29533 RepID=A0AB36P4Z4_9FLAO|nr:hypothetical protein [Flavobacterium pectinovorum]OXB06436.1 hypothetical protein B0A72_05155 [Flavobacterium pectinovorum]SHL89191.1 hypothetical protein SAMN05444387_1370 [Flavobacterium pectinovorum]